MSEPAPKKMKPATSGIPVTLLSGFLGSGKTTLLKNILEQKEGLEVAVLVNDMAELNIDASLVKKGNLLQSEEKVVEMQNGCICCTLREDLLLEMTKLATLKKFDAIVIESTGVSEPQQVAETFTFPIDMTPPNEEDEKNPSFEENPMYRELKKAIETLGYTPESLDDLTKLDTCVTVVDCKAFSGDLTTCGFLLERFADIDKEDDRTIATLLIDQIEFADVILLNKCDLVTDEEAAKIQKAIKVLNPTARVHKTVKSKIPMKEVMKTGLFNMEKASRSAGWLQSLSDGHTPETEEYGIGSFVYRARTPFHPTRLADLLTSIFMINMTDYEEDGGEEEEEHDKNEDSENDKKEDSKNADKNGNGKEEDSEDEEEEEDIEERDATCAKGLANMRQRFGQILRSKGFLWMAGRDMQAGEWSQAGAVATLDYGGVWPGLMPEDLRPSDDKDFQKDCLPGVIRDRRQEIVFIGQDLDKKAIIAALDGCLLRPEDIKKGEGEKKSGEDAADPEHGWKFCYEPTEEDPLPTWPDPQKELERLAAGDDDEDEEGHHGHHHHHHHHHKREH